MFAPAEHLNTKMEGKLFRHAKARPKFTSAVDTTRSKKITHILITVCEHISQCLQSPLIVLGLDELF